MGRDTGEIGFQEEPQSLAGSGHADTQHHEQQEDDEQQGHHHLAEPLDTTLYASRHDDMGQQEEEQEIEDGLPGVGHKGTENGPEVLSR